MVLWCLAALWLNLSSLSAVFTLIAIVVFLCWLKKIVYYSLILLQVDVSENRSFLLRGFVAFAAPRWRKCCMASLQNQPLSLTVRRYGDLIAVLEFQGNFFS